MFDERQLNVWRQPLAALDEEVLAKAGEDAVDEALKVEHRDDQRVDGASLFGEMAFLDVLSVTAILSTVGMFLTGLAICRTIRNRGSTDGISAFPFVSCYVGCVFWLRYGFLKSDRTVILINAIGFGLEVGYMLYYYVYTFKKSRVNPLIGTSIAIIGAMLFYIDIISPPLETAIAHLGLMCLTLNILGFAAPMASVREVIETKSADNLPFPLIAANLAVALQWFLYGYLINDIYMKVPNGVGVLLSALQLSLFAIYPGKAQTRK